MNKSKLLRQAFGIILLVIVFWAGYGSPATAESPTPTPPGQPAAEPRLLKFIRAVQVTPDDQYLTGAFARINYVPATDHFVVTFGGGVAHPSGGCGPGKAFSYKEYTTDMRETGKAGTFACDIGDAGSVMIDNTYYFAAVRGQLMPTKQDGWHLLKIDAVSWKPLVDTFFPLDYPKEEDADPMVAYVNGQIDISSGYNVSGKPHQPSDPAGTYGTHHQFFSTDLKFLSKTILTDPGHIHGSYMVFVDGIYYLVTAASYDGDVILIKYDKNWKYLGGKTLIKQAHFPTGLVYDGQRFYLAYTDTRQRFGPSMPPVALNIRLAAFDRDWNLLDDVAVTSYTPPDGRQPGRPWVILHGSRLYVSYDVDKADHTAHTEALQWQAYVSVYELNPAFSPVPTQQSAATPAPAQPGQPTSPAGASVCGGDQVSPLGVLRSTDHGATWTSLGNACMHDSTVWAVDPTGFRIDNRIVLYFVDFGSLNQPVPQIIYRATSEDGVHFDKPQPAYTQARTMVDPFVLRMADGTFRLYTPSDQEGIISAVSRDGLAFTREDGVRTFGGIPGGMPGALLLPDNRVRVFGAGAYEGKAGIFSAISKDGLNFTAESGVRIETPPHSIIDNPQPIRLADGSYLMLYQIHDVKYEGAGSLPWEHTEIHLAASVDGFNWNTNPTIIGYGGTSCVVETADGTLLIYYVNR